MNFGVQLRNRQAITFLGAASIAALLLASVGFAQAQQGGSLADAARQVRAQKQTQPQNESQAQQYADELAEDQTENGAPGGFKTYNTGDYKAWVPAPYHIDGHDPSGVVLSGPMVGVRHLVVMLGTPVVAHFEKNDAAFEETALQFAHLYADQAHCTKATVADHVAYQCSMAVATLLGQRVTGNAVFVRSLGSIYPMFCFTPSDSSTRDYINNTANSYNKTMAEKSLARETDEVKTLLQKCDTFFQSIKIPEGLSAQKSAASVAGSAVAAGKGAPANGGANPGAASLADTTQQPHAPAQGSNPPSSMQNPEANGAIPAGLKVHAFTYCKTSRDCFDASVLVPAQAQLVSSDCKQYIFETKVKGTPFLLLAGSEGSDACGRSVNDPNMVRWNQLVLPETQRAPGTSSTISSLQASVDGRQAIITTIGFRKGMDNWIGKRVEVESNGVQLVVGCLSPRETFYDGETVCTQLIESLRLP